MISPNFPGGFPILVAFTSHPHAPCISTGRADDRLVSCRAGCDAVDGVLADFGLQAGSGRIGHG